MRITYHLVLEAFYQACNPTEPYTPEDFERDGFIHCTDGIENVIQIGNWHFKADPRPWLLLIIDKSKVTAKVVFKDPKRIYPHVYGPLNRDSIVAEVLVQREADGTFLTTGLGDEAASP